MQDSADRKLKITALFSFQLLRAPPRWPISLPHLQGRGQPPIAGSSFPPLVSAVSFFVYLSDLTLGDRRVVPVVPRLSVLHGRRASGIKEILSSASPTHECKHFLKPKEQIKSAE